MALPDMKRLRRLGVLVPVFSLRRDDDLGIGDTRALREMVDWASQHRVGFLQLLPINETGVDNSPYNAISSVALDPVLLNMEELPGMTKRQIRAAEKKHQTKSDELVDYDSSNAAKWDVLEQGFRHFLLHGNGRDALELFQRDEKDWLLPYCKFRYLMELAGTERWNEWPENYNTAEKAEVYLASVDQDELEERLEFYAWVQWHAFNQWRELRAYAESQDVKLMGDIPIGVSYASADVFFEPQWFDLSLSGGSPPETVFKDDAFACQWGQNWGIPLYDWERLAQDDYRWWRRRIEKLTDVFHIFRIDHILGFYRIYSFPWRPDDNATYLGLSEEEAKALTGGSLPGFSPRPDDTQKNRDANLSDGDRYLKMVLDAAGDGEVVGEDLGCVPDYVRPHLERLGIAGFKVCHWESMGDGRAVKGSDYPQCSFATYATHDHDPIPALWNTLVGMLGGLEHEGAMRGLALLSDFAGLPKGKTMHDYARYGSVVKWSLLGSLLKSNADYAAVMITDVIDSEKRINIPGTVGGENWRYRLPWKLEEMPGPIQSECQRLTELIHIAGRG
ncbi:4-alpha-glucanotransferase [Verrucomicrobiaceae bacterium N1E253]|uniref:4-alpha-glucanotransferase n=1 Tax=Oceaniferula marina TaxID=2748318 RepID=A0A851GKD4_9BACT|nr:4-alpha-glucanotransferase [Oceaniferula marina]NWK56311.1 4-alpha-glucanotransferase [Oceaniferula marina]